MGKKPELIAIYELLTKPTFKKNTYVNVYEVLFGHISDPVLIEVGVLGGGSLELWTNYFGPGAKVIGIDLNPVAKTTAPKGVEVHILDQSSSEEWKKFWEVIREANILIDDGGHLDHQQITTVLEALPHITDGGLIVVEDTDFSYRAELKNPSKKSFISFVYSCIDAINTRDQQVHMRLTQEQEIVRRYVHNIQIFTTMVVFTVNRKECVDTAPMIINQSGDETPTDYRLHGTPNSKIRRLQLAVRNNRLYRYSARYRFTQITRRVINLLISKFVRW